MHIIPTSCSPNQRRRGNPKPWNSLTTAEHWQRLIRQAPELAAVMLILESARPPLDLQQFHANVCVWQKVIFGLSLPCLAPGSPIAGRTQRAIEQLLLDSAKPMGRATS